MTTTTRREAIREFLDRRYNGMIPVTGEMTDAVLSGLAEQDEPGVTAVKCSWPMHRIEREVRPGKTVIKLRGWATGDGVTVAAAMPCMTRVCVAGRTQALAWQAEDEMADEMEREHTGGAG